MRRPDIFSPKSSGIFRRSLRVPLPEPASLTNLQGIVSDARWIALKQTLRVHSNRKLRKEKNMARTSETNQGAARNVGIKLPSTALERALVILSRYREASIAVVALVLAIYFQVGSNGALLSSQELSVVLRDTGRFVLIAVAEVMLMITGEIDLSVGSTFSLAPYVWPCLVLP
jgi:hypothetical protein